MNNFSKIKKKIRRYGLRPATERKLSLFAFSCIAYGYSKILPKYLGFGYDALGAIGRGEKWYSLLNEVAVAKKTKQFIDRNFDRMDSLIFSPTKEVLEEAETLVSKEKKMIKAEPREYLEVIVDFYPRLIAVLGIYNCFWRYLGDNKSKGKITKILAEGLGEERG